MSMGGSVNVKGYMGDVAILETDKDLLVEFHRGKKFNEAASKAASTPIYDEADFCKIIRPGEPHSVWDQPVREIDKMRFADKWNAYQTKTQSAQSGTPLDLLFPDNPATVAMLKAIHVHTIQVLSNISDNAIGNIPFGHDLRVKAQRYMAATEKSVDFHKIEREMAELKAANISMQAQLANLPDANQEVKRRGRPPKQQSV